MILSFSGDDVMTKTISQLWSGNLDPVTRLGMNNTEIAKMEKLMSDNYSKLKSKLNSFSPSESSHSKSKSSWLFN